MSRASLDAVLRNQIEKLSGKSYDELRRELVHSLAYTTDVATKPYDVEVSLLEDLPEYLQVGVAVSDRSVWRSFFPLSRSFLVYRDGRVDK